MLNLMSILVMASTINRTQTIAAMAIPARRYAQKVASLNCTHPHDKQGNFESHLINNRPTRFTFMDNKILSLYSKAMTTRIMIKKAIYLVLGVNMNDHKGLLDLWLSKNEGAKF